MTIDETERPTLTETYRHTQFGTLPIIALGVPLAGMGILTVARFHPFHVTLFGFLALLLANFATLTVFIDDDGVHLRFGIGLIRRSFPLNRIRSVQAARNRFYYGWGIRRTPDGWLFNISGLDGVRIEMDDGRAYRIGTDEPEALARAIESRSVAVQ